MSRLFLALCAVGVMLFPLTGHAAAPAVDCHDPVVTGQRFAMTCAYSHQSMPLTLVLRGAVKGTTALPSTLEIRSGDTLRQTLSIADHPDGVALADLQIASIDVNFDGHDDLEVAVSEDANGNMGMAILLYDSATRMFARRPDLDGLLSGPELTMDPANKTIVVTGKTSCCSLGSDTYRWHDNQLTIAETHDSGDPAWGVLYPNGGALADVPSIHAFINAPNATGSICATRTDFYDANGAITKEVIETQGDICDDKDDYRQHAKAIDKTPNGDLHSGNHTDTYRDGILFQRTIVYDPPKKP
jgi:hypothetical protein